jgi:hypothetical protein
MYEQSSNDIATGYIMGRDANNNNCNSGWGFGNGEWIWAIIILALLGNGGWGFGNGFGGGFGGGFIPYAPFGFGGFGGGCGTPCATQADVRAAVDQQTLISKIDQQTYGIADTFTALNNTLNNNFRGVDNAICTLGYQALQNTNSIQTQLADCCCGIKGEIKDVAYGNERNSWNISKQISDCCCDLEKANMQNRFDAQVYNCNTLQAIDKLGDRIIDYLSADKVQALRDENFALRLSASQAKQNEYLVERLNPNPCPTPAYVVQPPQQVTFPTNCCGTVNVAGYGYNGGCGCGCN